MSGYELYVFCLCFIVFSIFTVLFTYMIYTIMKMQLKLMKHGHSDEEIIKEYEKEQNASSVLNWVQKILSVMLCLAFCAVFAFSMWLNATEDRPANGIPSIKVVKSESMASKHKENAYLSENNLNDQLQMFDIVVCNHLPAEDELELYDIVVYKYDDYHIIHRIVGIEEPNEKHPNERHFLLKGDANKYSDEFPVLYSQMQGIYEGFRIPFVGSFVMFMQSPAGWLVILLVLFSMVGTPIVEKTWIKARNQRLIEIGVIVPEPEENAAEGDTSAKETAETNTDAPAGEPENSEQITEEPAISSEEEKELEE